MSQVLAISPFPPYPCEIQDSKMSTQETEGHLTHYFHPQDPGVHHRGTL